MNRPLPLLALVLAAAAACGGAHPLGSVAEDKVPLAEVRELRHVEAVLQKSGMKVMDLFTKRNLKFTGAPNPQQLLKSYQLDNEERAFPGENLSVLSYNVALLKATPFGINYAVSPELDVRLARQPEIIMSRHYDIILLQEVWHDFALEEYQNKAPGLGYRLFAQGRGYYTDGLVILVRQELIAPGTEPVVDHAPYEQQDPKEFWPGPKVKRGWLSVAFQHPSLGVIHVFDTHTQAYPEAWDNRMFQGRELGIQVREAVGEGEIGIIGGDMNAGPYYRSDSWFTPDGKESKQWWNNALSWALTLHYAGAQELFAMGTEAQDVYLGNTVQNHWRDSTRIPGSEEGWCARTPAVVFSASDCNELYFRQYAGTEYPARLDHLMVRDVGGRVRVTGSGLEFTERMEWETGEFELSDHYGVSVGLVVR